MYFESHAHYDDEAYDCDRDALLELLPQNGIDFVIQVGASMETTRAGIALAEQYPYIYAAVGVHPHEVKKLGEQDMLILEEYCRHDKVVAVGETGLDYYYHKEPEARELQRHWFCRQLILAKKVNKPVIIHSRDASEDTFNIISKENMSEGVVHCYSGSPEMAIQYVEMGFFIGVGGVITFKNAKKLVQVVEAIPLESLLIETDSPYLSPLPNRGARNDSRNLAYIVEKIAYIKQMSKEDVAKQTKANAFKLFF